MKTADFFLEYMYTRIQVARPGDERNVPSSQRGGVPAVE